MLFRAAFVHYHTLIHSTSSCAVSCTNNSLSREVYAKTEKANTTNKIEKYWDGGKDLLCLMI